MLRFLASIGIGTWYASYYAVYLTVVVVLIWTARHRPRFPRRVRVGAAAVAGVLLVRLVLFENPWMPRVYLWALTVENLGYRQGDVLDLEIRNYRRDIHQARLANLAVGSSQVSAIFHYWTGAAPLPPLGVYSLAGMKGLDLVLNEEAIAALNPQRVILYLSAFDMTGRPELFSLPLAPSQPTKIWSIYRGLRAAGLTEEEIAPGLHAYIFSQLFPEYRYSFVSRAFIRQWFGGAPRPTQAWLRPPEISDYFDARWLDYNFLFLRDFLAFCDAGGIEVLVVEGQINPSFMTPAIDGLNAEVRRRIVAMRSAFAHLRYVPASEVYIFSAAEYRDTKHVWPEAAERYTAKLSAYLMK